MSVLKAPYTSSLIPGFKISNNAGSHFIGHGVIIRVLKRSITGNIAAMVR